MEYTYNILSLKKKTIGEYSDVVCGITWRKTGTDENGFQGKCDTYDDLGINESNLSIQRSITLTDMKLTEYIRLREKSYTTELFIL